MARPRVHLIIGTRPEAIKMAPLAAALAAKGHVDPVLVSSGQHPTMVEQALAAFDLRPDISLRFDRPTGEQAELVAALCPMLDRALANDSSAAVIVQGDTTTALVGGLVAFWRKIPLIHLEAGLRTGDLAAPFPEEANRRLVGVLADLHLAPTQRAVDALLAENVHPDKVFLVGNTVVDAVLTVAAKETPLTDRRLATIQTDVAKGNVHLMLATVHRRESWGPPLGRVLRAVRTIVDERPDLRCVLPAHPNPSVRSQVLAELGGHPQVVVTEPLEYPVLSRLLAMSTIILSDSGGIQEEAPSFRVPVLVLREVTERIEAVESGWAHLVGTETSRIVSAARTILDGTKSMPDCGNPFGDGRASTRSADAIACLLKASTELIRSDEQSPRRQDIHGWNPA